MRSKIIFYSLWSLIFLVGPVTVYLNTPFKLAISSQPTLISYFQRMTGLLAFSLIFFQIMLGALMDKLIEKLGAWVFKFHVWQGALIYSLIFLHPLLFVFLNFKIKGVFDPFYVFTDICVLCKGAIEYYYTFGRLAFWLITVAVIAAKFRTHPWLRLHWRKFHLLNYFAFYLIALHSWKVGSDVRSAPFVWFYWLAITIISMTVLYRFNVKLRVWPSRGSTRHIMPPKNFKNG